MVERPRARVLRQGHRTTHTPIRTRVRPPVTVQLGSDKYYFWLGEASHECEVR